jgi:hypothetical protein
VLLLAQLIDDPVVFVERSPVVWVVIKKQVKLYGRELQFHQLV